MYAAEWASASEESSILRPVNSEYRARNALRRAEPEKAEHIWDLVYDSKRSRLFAATGPEGKIVSVDAKGKVLSMTEGEKDWNSGRVHRIVKNYLKQQAVGGKW